MTDDREDDEAPPTTSRRGKHAAASVGIASWLRPSRFEVLERAVEATGTNRSQFIRDAVEHELDRLSSEGII